MIHSLFGYEVEELNNDDPLLDKVIYCFDMLRDCGLDVYVVHWLHSERREETFDYWSLHC